MIGKIKFNIVLLMFRFKWDGLSRVDKEVARTLCGSPYDKQYKKLF